MLGYYIAAPWSKRRLDFRKFLPPWVRQNLEPKRSDDAVIAAMEKMFEEASRADDQHPDG